jgi:hypothetical protein
MLEFYDQNTGGGLASLYERHISFNTKLIKYFDDCYKVRVGIDKEDNKIYVFIYDRDYALSGEIPESSLLSIQVSKSYVRISSKQLIEYICDRFKLEIPKKSFLQYKASYNEAKKAIVMEIEGD